MCFPGARANFSDWARNRSGLNASDINAATELHFVPDRPQIVEDRSEQRFFQKRDAGRAARAFLRADRSLDQFDVPVTPLLQSLIEVGHQFEQNRAFRRFLVQSKYFLLDALVWSICLRYIAVLYVGGNLCAASDKEIIEMINDASFVKQFLQAIVSRKLRLQICHRRC